MKRSLLLAVALPVIGWLLPPAQGALAAQAGDEAAPVAAADATVRVYKKWVGAAGDEPDVEIHLFCRQGEKFPPRSINGGEPNGWDVPDVPAAGVFCSVFEVEQATFVADDEDCRELLVLPGKVNECTIVNTRLVKRIGMFNRYGLTLMALVMLGAGLWAVARLGRPRGGA